MRVFITGAVIAFVSILSCVIAFSARAEPALVLVIDNEISASAMVPLADALRAVVVKNTKQPVTVVINSPGGAVDAGMAFINLMGSAKAQGSKITCYVQDLAMSMAFQILTQCTTRYALPTSLLLWHGVRIQTRQPITAELAHQMADEIENLNEVFKYQLYPSMRMSRSEIDKAFVNEETWTGIGLRRAAPQFIKLMPSYPKVWPLTETGVRMKAPSVLDFFNKRGYGVMCTWSGYRRGK